MVGNFLGKLILAQLAKEFFAFYRMFTRADTEKYPEPVQSSLPHSVFH
jgi:hypothetical protein